MARAHLRRLKLSGFASFRDEVCIDLPERGVVLVNGINEDTKGSSGSGKSSLVLSIPFALGYSPVPGTELQSWDVPTMKVVLEMDTEQGRAIVSRGAGLTLSVAGEKVRGGAAAIEKRLAELHGLPAHFLEVMTYRQQKKPGIFLSLEPSKKLKFLTKLLDLDRFEEAAESARKEADRLEVRVGALGEAAQRAEAHLACVRSECREAQLLDEGPLEEAVRNAEVALSALAPRWTAARERGEQAVLAERAARSDLPPDPTVARILGQLDECRTRLAAARERDAAATENHRASVLAARQQLAALSAQTVALGDPIGRERQARSALEMVLAKECPTCHQEWVGDAARERADQLRETIRKAQNDARTLQELRDQRPALEAQAHAERVPEPILGRLEAIERHLAGQLQAAEEGATARGLAMYAQQVAEAKAHLSAVRAEIAQAQTAVAEARAHLQQTQAVNAATTAEAQASERRIAEAQRNNDESKVRLCEEMVKLAEERDFCSMIGKSGYLGAIFDEVLQDIGLRTSSLLSSIPNVAHCSFVLKSSRPTQTGEKKGIIPTVTMGEERPLRSCSGGMTTSIELATDLAVSSVLAERTGARPTWLILDEPFDGLDQVSKEACLELLRETAEAEGKLILVIDHSAEFKEMFEQVVVVRYSAGRSWIDAL